MSRALVALALLALPVLAHAQGTPMPFVRIQFFDLSGNPCNGCKLNAYAAGTTTRQDTFTTVTLTPGTENTNPVVMNAAGYPTTGYIYLSATSYRFVLTDSTGGTTYWDMDNTPAIPATSTGIEATGQIAGEALATGDIVYLSDGSGALTAGRWYKADADFTYASSLAGMVGEAPAVIASAATGTIRIGGRATGLSGLTAGTIYYISATAGALTATAPTNARFMGSADTTTSLVFAGDPTYASVLMQASRINTSTPYTLTWPAALAAGTLQSGTTGALAFAPVPANIAEGRLTATTAVSVTTTDVSAATSIYYTPHTGTRISLYDGTNWNVRTFAEITISVASCTASKPYDVFLYDNAGTVTAEQLVWTNATTRATALVRQDGIWSKTGALTRRYVGSYYCNSSAGHTDDTLAKRLVFNMDNRVLRPLRRIDPTATWAYNSGTIRQADFTNVGTANQIEVMVGLPEDLVQLGLAVQASGTIGDFPQASIGVDSTTVFSTEAIAPGVRLGSANGMAAIATYVGYPGYGYHTLTWLEARSGAAAVTFSGTNGCCDINGLYGFWKH